MEKIHYYRQNFKKQFLEDNSKAIYLLFKHATFLYNQALYIQKKRFEEGKSYLKYFEMRDFLKEDKNYKILGDNISISIIRNLDINYKNFFVNNQKSKNLTPPFFRNLKSDYFISFFSLYLTKEKTIRISLTKNFKEKYLVEDIIIRVCDNFYNKNKKITQLRFCKNYVCYHYVEKIKRIDENNSEILGLDLGVDNLISGFCTKKGSKNFIISGKSLKFINYKFLTYDLKNEKRKNKIENYFDKCVKFLLKYCIKNSVKNVVCGFFKDIKKKHKNRNFYYIPFLILRRKIQNQLEKIGINVIFTEESYTSKSCFLLSENLCKKENYYGYRAKRGLHKIKGVKISYNCDINGAANIIRKKFIIDDLAIIKKVLENPKKYK